MGRRRACPCWVLQAAIGLLTMAFSLVIGNVGATVVMVPMAINVALAAGGNPLAFAMLVGAVGLEQLPQPVQPGAVDDRRPRRLPAARPVAHRRAADRCATS